MNKTVLKARYGSELRKNWIYHNNDVSLDDLISKMQRYFNIKELDGIKLKYRDEEDDWITLTNDDDLSFALSTMEILYVEVFFENAKNMKEKSCNSDEKVSEENTDMGQKQLLTTKQVSIEQLTDIPLNNEDGLQHQHTYISGVPLPPPVSNFGMPPVSQQIGPSPTLQHIVGVQHHHTTNVGAKVSQSPPIVSCNGLPPTSQQMSGAQQFSSFVGGAVLPPVQQPSCVGGAVLQPPMVSNFGLPPTSQQMGGVQQQPSFVGGQPSIVSNFGLPPTSQQMGFQPTSQQMSLPPSQQGGIQPASQQMGFPLTQQGGMPPASQQMGFPSSQQMGGIQQQPSYAGAGVLPPPPMVSSIGTHGTSANPFSRQR